MRDISHQFIDILKAIGKKSFPDSLMKRTRIVEKLPMSRVMVVDVILTVESTRRVASS